MLARLGERGLDDQVVERDGGGELRPGAVAAQLVGHTVEAGEDLLEAPAELGLRGGQRGGDRVAGVHDLRHEAREEDGVAGLVDLLGGEEVLLVLTRCGVDVGSQIGCDAVLAVEEHRVVPQCGAALEV